MTLTPGQQAAMLAQEEAIASLAGTARADSDVARCQRAASFPAVVRGNISEERKPDWMLQSRQRRCIFRPQARSGAPTSMASIRQHQVLLKLRSARQAAELDDLAEDIHCGWESREAEKQRLVAGVAAQYESEVYITRSERRLKESLLRALILVAKAPRIFSGIFRWLSTSDNKFFLH